ncbi:hypothetical protein MXL28_17305 [Klebsiella aerogenes]|uniref:hypothetical protein n=1 Tax=Klebsiella aerogenes TaxID=548 RepID=UPI002DBFB2D9|nr:hypothetical protein [Klebsiella aerogenes]MEB6655049.1 hypothetical protein [Klebsiella aerogenes]
MTKSTITDERITSVIERLEHFASNLKWTDVRGAQDLLTAADGLRELQERRKADSEPVAWRVSFTQIGHESNNFTKTYWDEEEKDRWVKLHKMSGYKVVVEPLYRHAQPAQVVPAVSDDIGEIRVGRLPTMNQDDYPGLGDWWVQLRIGEDSDEVLARVYGATPQEANSRAEALACRAAMLQAEPVTTANKLPFEQWLSQQTGTIDVECGCVMTEVFFNWLRVAYEAGNSPEQGESRCGTKGAPALDSLSKNAESRCGYTPVIPDGYVMVPMEPTGKQWAAGVQAFDSGMDKVIRIYKAMLAAAPQEVK